MFYVYIYRHPETLEPFYVGKGKNERAYSHLKSSKNMHLQNKIKKIQESGIDPIVELIEAIDEHHALFLEVCLIDVIGRSDLGKGPLTNKTDGGEGLKNASFETREKMRLAKIGKKKLHNYKITDEHRLAISRANKGRTLSIETKEKMSAAKRGIPLNPEAIAKRTATRASNLATKLAAGDHATMLNKTY